MVNVNGARLTAGLIIVCVTVVVVVQLNRPVVNYFSSTGVLESGIQKLSGPVSWSTVTMDLPNFSPDIGKGPLSFVRQKGLIGGLVKQDLDSSTTEELLMTIHSYTDNSDILCQRKFRMGNIGDGGWEICDDPDVRPREPCIIYSFGINNDFSFDDDAAKTYGCHVYAFDPSMSNVQDQFDRSTNVHFYKIGIDGKTYVNDKKWQLFTFQDIRKKLGHQNVSISLVKMDIESSEWGTIPQMAESKELDNVKQLLIEFHVTSQSRDYLLPRLKAIQAIEKSGLKKFYTHKNPACGTTVSGFPVTRTMCYEVHYMRR